MGNQNQTKCEQSLVVIDRKIKILLGCGLTLFYSNKIRDFVFGICLYIYMVLSGILAASYLLFLFFLSISTTLIQSHCKNNK